MQGAMVGWIMATASMFLAVVLVVIVQLYRMRTSGFSPSKRITTLIGVAALLRCAILFSAPAWEQASFAIKLDVEKGFAKVLYVMDELAGLMELLAYAMHIAQWIIATHNHGHVNSGATEQMVNSWVMRGAVAVGLVQAGVWLLYIGPNQQQELVASLIGTLIHSAALLALAACVSIYGTKARRIVEGAYFRQAARVFQARELYWGSLVCTAAFSLRAAVLVGLSITQVVQEHHNTAHSQAQGDEEGFLFIVFYMLLDISPLCTLLWLHRHPPLRAARLTLSHRVGHSASRDNTIGWEIDAGTLEDLPEASNPSAGYQATAGPAAGSNQPSWAVRQTGGAGSSPAAAVPGRSGGGSGGGGVGGGGSGGVGSVRSAASRSVASAALGDLLGGRRQGASGGPTPSSGLLGPRNDDDGDPAAEL